MAALQIPSNDQIPEVVTAPTWPVQMAQREISQHAPSAQMCMQALHAIVLLCEDHDL
jgi:hypothetical protein